jgi:small redox-active disulfide protein 2
MVKVKVLGPGCSKCKLLEQKLINLKSSDQLDFEVEKVTRLDEIMSYGIMMTPGLVINGQVKSSGTIPKDEQIINWIKEA